MQWLGPAGLGGGHRRADQRVLHLLVDWPESAGAVAPSDAGAGADGGDPVGLGALHAVRVAVLVHAMSAVASSAVVAVVYLVIVLGLGEAPDGPRPRLLGFSSSLPRWR